MDGFLKDKEAAGGGNGSQEWNEGPGTEADKTAEARLDLEF